MRRPPIVTDYVYHVCNRGVNKNAIFFSNHDYARFLNSALHYKYNSDKFSDTKRAIISRYPSSDPGSGRLASPKVEILSYCLMPNHFHLLLKQLEDGGITWYIQHLLNSHVHYINTKYKRVGPLFQGRFRSIVMQSDEQLLHVVRYIHLNPVVANIVKEPVEYIWSSHKDYMTNIQNSLVDTQFVSSFFSGEEQFGKFVNDHIEYARTLEAIKHVMI